MSVDIDTASEDLGEHAIFFNRGVAGSQAYARKFGNVRPDEITDPAKQKAAWRWLSRGLEEAMLKFIGQANSSDYGLRAAVYEFSYLPALEALGEAGKVADVKIIYDRRKNGPWVELEKAIKAAGIEALMIPRTVGSAISHNKFIVLLYKGKPVQVWTGSTNFTAAGIFGQSNVGHIIRNEDVAQAYLDYWTRLSADPSIKELAAANTAAGPNPAGDPSADVIATVFSPRNDLGALEWYGERMGAATQTLGFTAAFGISTTLAPALLQAKDFLRFIMVETEGNKSRAKPTPANPNPKSQFEVFGEIAKMENNRTAVGSVLSGAGEDAVGDRARTSWLMEKLTGLNTHVKYLHTKYMFVDAMTDTPTVISGSANFSGASTTAERREHGDRARQYRRLRYLPRRIHAPVRPFLLPPDRGEAAQERTARPQVADHSFYLAPDDSWAARFFDPKSSKFMERKLFA